MGALLSVQRRGAVWGRLRVDVERGCIDHRKIGSGCKYAVASAFKSGTWHLENRASGDDRGSDGCGNAGGDGR